MTSRGNAALRVGGGGRASPTSEVCAVSHDGGLHGTTLQAGCSLYLRCAQKNRSHTQREFFLEVPCLGTKNKTRLKIAKL